MVAEPEPEDAALPQGWTAPPVRLRVGELPDPPLGTVHRQAVRAVVRRDCDLLLLRSTATEDLKFPGGGVEPGESLGDALVREVREECGRAVTSIDSVLLVIQELRPGLEPGWVLSMTSTYVACSVGEVDSVLTLEAYERDLGLTPLWVGIAAAIRANESALAAGTGSPWTARELAALRELAAILR